MILFAKNYLEATIGQNLLKTIFTILMLFNDIIRNLTKAIFGKMF